MTVGVCTNNIDIAIQGKKSNDCASTSKNTISDSIFTQEAEKTKLTDKPQKEETTKKPEKEKPFFDKALEWFKRPKNLAGLILCSQGLSGLCVSIAMSSPIMTVLLGGVGLTSIGLGIYCLATKNK